MGEVPRLNQPPLALPPLTLGWTRPLARRGALLLTLGWLALVALLLAALLVPLPRWQSTVNIGAEQGWLAPGQGRAFHNLFGFHEAERAQDGSGRAFRWTSAEQATLTLPFAQQAAPLRLDLLICGCRTEAVPLELHLNQRPLAATTASDEWRRYSVLVPPDLPHPESGLFIALQSTLATRAEGRSVGVAVAQVAATQARPAPLAEPLTLPLVLLAGTLLTWRTRRLTDAALLAGGWLLVGALYTPALLARWQVSLLALAALLLLWLVAQRVRLAAPVWAGLGLWLALAPLWLGFWLLDDAFISLRYARHLVEGHGLVFNVGERVEGYTNFLWTLLLAAGLALGADPLTFAVLLSGVLGAALVGLSVLLAARLVPPGWAWAAGVLVALSSPVLLYSVRGSGMETALFAVLGLAVLLAALARRWLWAGLLAALLLLTRPDGLLLAGAAGVYALWTGGRGGALRYGGVLVALYVPYYAWRWAYYGYPLPNTFYAKVGGTAAQAVRGLEYVAAFARDEMLLLAGAGGLLLGLLATRGRPEPEARRVLVLLLGAAALTLAYVVAVGGDWMPGARFLVSLVPLLAVLCVWGLWAAAARWRRWAGGAWAGVGLLALLLALRLPQTTSYHPDSPIWHELLNVRRYREIGRWLHLHTPPDTLIVAEAAGALPYYAARPTIDVLGLNDEHIAHQPGANLGQAKAGHEKTDPAYVLARRPHIIPRVAANTLTEQPAFRADYRLEKVAGPEGFTLRLYVRRDMPPLPWTQPPTERTR
jgi:hypothetical protein